MTTQSRSPTGQYWKNHILSWEAGAYFKHKTAAKLSPWDRISPLFRGDGMYARMEAAQSILAPHVSGATILDIGCASGRLAFGLIRAGAKRVIGIDVAPPAIEIANRNRHASRYQDSLEFLVKDVTLPQTRLPQVDLVTALGVIEYFDGAELSLLMGKLKTRYFLFDFPDSGGRTCNRLTWYLRKIYLILNRCPGVYLYNQAEFRRLAAEHGFQNVWFVRYGPFDYVTNLPRPNQKPFQ